MAIQEAYFTVRDTLDNVDSPAIWHGPDDAHWLLATAKESDAVLVFDATDGNLLQRIGGSGTAAGELDRPNGIAVIDNLMLVVERDNKRVQVFSLPAFTSLGFIGEQDLEWPYGLAVYRDTSSMYHLYVTDNYETVDEQIPADSLLGARVKQFSFSIEDDALTATLVLSFGDTSGDGVLRVVESLAVDPANNRLLIAEEREIDSQIKVYTLDGAFTGETIASTFFPNQAEGIVLYPCGAQEGYWIATDQEDNVSTFHVFDRTTLAHVGTFVGAETANTDGIALTRTGFDPFTSGAFFAVHDDGNVAALNWQAISDALALEVSCPV